MKIFQLWLVFHSCIFMMLYFMTFLILKYSIKKSVCLCVAATAISMVFEIIRIYFVFDAPLPKLITTCMNIIVLQGTALLLSEKKNAYALFIGFSSANFVLAGNILSCGVFVASYCLPAAMAVCTLGNTAVFCFMAVMIRAICRNMLSKEISIWMCALPAMGYVTFYFILYYPVSFEQRPENILAALSLLATIVALYVFLIHYSDTKSAEKGLQWKNTTLSAYISGVKIQADAAEDAIQEFRVIRHDIRHKDSLLIELLQEGKYTEAEQILKKDIAIIDRKQVCAYCENTIINSILAGMAKRAHHMGIDLHMSCAVPKETNVGEYDLAMLSANLIENALQAVEKLEQKERVVTLTVKSREMESFFFEIKNPCRDKVLFSKKTGLPCSELGLGHGYGMKSVQNFVEKYHAEFDCLMEGQMFIVRILIRFL